MQTAIKQVHLREELLRRFKQYEFDRSRHNLVLLEEVVSAYLRADAVECLGILRSLNALFLVSSRTLASAASHIDLDDFTGVLKIASETDGATGDALIESAFRRQIEKDPTKAFEYLELLPRQLANKLGVELARSWGASDGPAAAAAFYKTERWGLVSPVLDAWGSKDPDAAFKFALSVENPRQRDELTRLFLPKLSETNPEGVMRLLAAHTDLSRFEFGQFVNAFGTLHDWDPQAELDAATSLPGKERELIYSSIAHTYADKDSAVTIQAAGRLPVSEQSLNIIQKAAGNLAGSAAEPYSLAEQFSDPYQQRAAMNGVSHALLQSQGLDGLTGIVREGLSSNSPAWLAAAASLILTAQPPPGPNGKGPSDWKSLPQDVADALASYAAGHLSPEALAALRAKLP